MPTEEQSPGQQANSLYKEEQCASRIRWRRGMNARHGRGNVQKKGRRRSSVTQEAFREDRESSTAARPVITRITTSLVQNEETESRENHQLFFFILVSVQPVTSPPAAGVAGP